MTLPRLSTLNGSELRQIAQGWDGDGWGGTTDFGLNCSMTGGSSGGPWWVNFGSAGSQGALNSVNSFKYTFGKFTKYMFGPYFGAYAQKTYIKAQSASSDLTVAP